LLLNRLQERQARAQLSSLSVPPCPGGMTCSTSNGKLKIASGA
jgi:hypothetical protein